MDIPEYSEEVSRKLKSFMSYFVGRKFGEPCYQRFPTPEELARYRGVLPDLLLAIWETVGFSAYADGGLWLVNPADYEDVLERILEPTVFIEQDIYHVIARNAWGELILWGEKSGNNLDITPSMQWVCTNPTNAPEQIAASKANEAMRWCLCMTQKSFLEANDEKDKPMLERAIAKLGKLDEDEMYGFAPFLFMGGKKRLENLQKVNIHTHLNLIADMGEFEVIDFAGMTRAAIDKFGA
ncbi:MULTISPECIES: GAD-like domain-containing protein [Shewanella]|uniref:GAD-like domain-containing protein n=1 Tax=Shewanella TaxID=22 RepID=UPI001AADA097|nr:GAD-like domain-containing protein [Shewanella algae]MBO2635276.1 DUF1851 domain-containing protein [Shewanella algae]QTE85935.1 DUF1851 domain-containing protein [Shewanella algae]